MYVWEGEKEASTFFKPLATKLLICLTPIFTNDSDRLRIAPTFMDKSTDFHPFFMIRCFKKTVQMGYTVHHLIFTFLKWLELYKVGPGWSFFHQRGLGWPYLHQRGLGWPPVYQCWPGWSLFYQGWFRHRWSLFLDTILRCWFRFAKTVLRGGNLNG